MLEMIFAQILKMSLMRKKNGKIINLLIKKFVILNGLIL